MYVQENNGGSATEFLGDITQLGSGVLAWDGLRVCKGQLMFSFWPFTGFFELTFDKTNRGRFSSEML